LIFSFQEKILALFLTEETYALVGLTY
jgi:hypothetical protein